MKGPHLASTPLLLAGTSGLVDLLQAQHVSGRLNGAVLSLTDKM